MNEWVIREIITAENTRRVRVLDLTADFGNKRKLFKLREKSKTVIHSKPDSNFCVNFRTLILYYTISLVGKGTFSKAKHVFICTGCPIIQGAKTELLPLHPKILDSCLSFGQVLMNKCVRVCLTCVCVCVFVCVGAYNIILHKQTLGKVSGP